MNYSVQLISGVESASLFLATIPALWISGRIILHNYPGEYRALQIFLWFALGGQILTPLMHFFRYLSSVLTLLIPSSNMFGSVSVFLGMAPYQYFSTIILIQGIAVYGLSLYYVRKLVTQGRLPFIQGLQLSSWEFRFVLLGIAGQVNNMVSGIVVNFVSIYFPSLTAQLDLTQLFKGFWISWLIAFIILILILFCMNELLYRREKKLSP